MTRRWGEEKGNAATFRVALARQTTNPLPMMRAMRATNAQMLTSADFRSRIGFDEFARPVHEYFVSAVCALIGSLKKLCQGAFHAVVIRVCFVLRAEETSVHHPAIDSAGDGERRDSPVPLKGDSRAQRMFLITENSPVLGTTLAESRS